MAIKLTVSQPSAVELNYVEAKIKPETVGHVTPTYESQTVYPVPGTVFGSVEVEAMPTGTKQITHNGAESVRGYDEVNVNVQPNLQTSEATPTEQTQTVTPDGQHDGLSSVTVHPIPSQYIVPQGVKQITENGTGIDVSQYATADVAVPMPEEYAVGSMADNSITEYHFSPNAQAASFKSRVFSGYTNLQKIVGIPSGTTSIPTNFASGCTALQECSLPNSVSLIDEYAFYGDSNYELSSFPTSLAKVRNQAFYLCKKVTANNLPQGIVFEGTYQFSQSGIAGVVVIPSNVTVIPGHFMDACTGITGFTFMGDITAVNSSSLGGTSAEFYDFRYCTAVPTLGNQWSIGGATGYKIVVPDALVTQWKAATNWTIFADHIIGVSDYDNS